MMSDVLAQPPEGARGPPGGVGGPGGPSGGGGAGGVPGGPAKNPAAIGRLKRRMDSYRHHEDKSNRTYETSMSSFNHQQMSETLVLRQKYLDSTKTKKGSKKSAAEAKQKAAAAMNHGPGTSANNSVHTANGAPSYPNTSNHGMKRPRASLEDDRSGLEAPKRANLETEVKHEAVSPHPSAPDNPYHRHALPGEHPLPSGSGQSELKPLSEVGPVEIKEENKDDTLGDLDLHDFMDENGEGIMNPEMLNDLIGDLQDSDFMDNFDFGDSKSDLDDLTSSLGPELEASHHSGATVIKSEVSEDVKPPASLVGPAGPNSNYHPPPPSGHPMAGGGPKTSRQNSFEGRTNNVPPPPTSANQGSPHPQSGASTGGHVPTSLQQMDAAEKLKIMAQQHQQHHSGPPHSHPMFNTMTPMPPNGTMMRPAGIRPGIRPGLNPMPPNLPTAPIPQSAASSMGTPSSGIMTSSSQGPIMSRMMGPQMGPVGPAMPFNGSSPMTAEQVRMRAQSRYRMGTPNPSNIRHPLPPHSHPPSSSQGPRPPQLNNQIQSQPHQQQPQHQPHPHPPMQSSNNPQPPLPQQQPQPPMMQNPAMRNQNQNMPFMMGGQMPPGNMPPNMRFPSNMGPRMGPRGGPGFQQIPPSGPMMRQQQQQQQQQHQMAMGPGGNDPQRMRFQGGPMGMMGNGAKQGPMPHGVGPGPHPMMGWGPNGQPHMGMGNVPMSGGSPNHPIVQGQNMPMGSPRGQISSPRPQGDINHGSPMMPHNSHPNIRSQSSGPMVGPGGVNSPMSANPNAGIPPVGPHQGVRMPGHPVGAMPQRMPNMPLPNQPNPLQQNPNQVQAGLPPGGPPGPPSHQQQVTSQPPIQSPHMSHNSPMNHNSPMMGGGGGYAHSPMGQHPGMSPMGQRSNTPSHQHNGHPPNNNPKGGGDDFNLDFLDSIPTGGNGVKSHVNGGQDEILKNLFN
eukprot:maker-scaffold11_size778918-snap-gene-5.24 protein:Tk03676 transcript:maker-scaffold11_size778918-snap-gene-5.24-mRNA-1 annotation:"hypothetical protein BRAFLDRAFT_69639"